MSLHSKSTQCLPPPPEAGLSAPPRWHQPDLPWQLHCLVALQQAPGNLCQILLSPPSPSPPSRGFFWGKLLNFTFGSQYPHAVQIAWGVCPCQSAGAHSHQGHGRAQPHPQLGGDRGAECQGGKRVLRHGCQDKGPKVPHLGQTRAALGGAEAQS